MLNNLSVNVHNGVQVMSSVDLARLCVGESKDAHGNFMKKAVKVLGAEHIVNFYDISKDAYGRDRNILLLPERESCLMAMSYSYELQAQVYDRWKALETGKALPQIPPPVEPPKHPLVVKAEAIRDIHTIVKDLDISIYEYAKRQLFPDLIPNRVEAVRIPPPSETAVDEFLSLRCVVDPQGTALSKDIYSEYKKLGGMLSHNGFSRQLTSRGFYRHAVTEGRSFRGLRLK